MSIGYCVLAWYLGIELLVSLRRIKSQLFGGCFTTNGFVLADFHEDRSLWISPENEIVGFHENLALVLWCDLQQSVMLQ